MLGKSRLRGAWLFEAIAFPEDTIMVTLDGGIMLGLFQAFERPAAVFLVDFNAGKAAPKLLGDDGGGSTAQERVKDEIARAGTGEDEFRQELFGLLGGVVSVFTHGPVGDGDVVPEIRRAGEAVVPFFGFLPVLRNPVIAIGCNYAAFLLDSLHIEIVFASQRAEPDVLAAIFPVGFGATTLFALPGDAIPDMKIFGHDLVLCDRALPVSAQIHGGVRLEEAQKPGEPGLQIFLIGIIAQMPEFYVAELFVQIVWRIKDEQVHKGVWQKINDFEEVAMDNPVGEVVGDQSFLGG